MERDIEKEIYDEWCKLLDRYCKYLHLHTSIVATDEIISLYNKMEKERNKYIISIPKKRSEQYKMCLTYYDRIKNKEYPKG